MKKSSSPWPANLALVALVVVLDQIVKTMVVAGMALGEAIEILPFLALYHARNEGIAFSMFANLSDHGLSLMTIAVLVFVGWMWRQTPPGRRWTHFGFALIAGGAVGNLIDRVRLGYVVDYVLFHTPVWSFAVFNLADACITIGAGLVVLDEFILQRGREEESRPGARD